MTTAILPDLLTDAQTTEERFLRHIFVRDQLEEMLAMLERSIGETLAELGGTA